MLTFYRGRVWANLHLPPRPAAVDDLIRTFIQPIDGGAYFRRQVRRG